jgi:hypothetical protein
MSCSLPKKEGEKIIQKAVEAVGGQVKLKKIQDHIIESKVEFFNHEGEISDRGMVTEYYKYPDRIRIEFDLVDSFLINGFDGKTGWEQIDTHTAYEVDRERFTINLRLKQVPLSLIQDSNHAKVYRVEDERNRNLTVLEVHYPPNEKVKFYFDDTWLLGKYEGPSHSKQGSITSIMLNEYRSVQDVMIPYHLTYFSDGVKFQERWVQKIRMNEGIHNDFFENPQLENQETTDWKIFLAANESIPVLF